MKKFLIAIPLIGLIFFSVLQVQAQGGNPTETPTPTETATSRATNTALPPTATATPTQTFTAVPPTATPAEIPGDVYEDDTPPNASVYIGAQLRSFYPVGDVDYVRYRLKANIVTYFETHDLTGEADTFICVYRDDDGTLTANDPLLGCDDDNGPGLASYLILTVSAEMDVTVTIENQAIGYAPPVGYSFRIIAGPNATPSPTPKPPTATPQLPQPPATPYPTYTPYPTPTQASPTPQPTARPVTHQPAMLPTATSSPEPTLYISIFTDINDDKFMDEGEGTESTLVILSTLDRQWQMETYTVAGVATFISEDDFPVGEDEVLVQVPYLHRSGTFKLNDDQATTAEIVLEAVFYPVYLP